MRGLAALVLMQVARAASADPAASLAIRLDQAVLMALTNNRALSVQRLNPEIQKTFEDAARAAFDPTVVAAAAFSHARPAGSGPTGDTADVVSGSLGVTEVLPTGTKLGISAAAEKTAADPAYDGRAGVAITQALLRGRPIAANLASLRQARIDTDISAYELRGFAEALVADVEGAYWDSLLARRSVEIFEQSLSLAERQLKEVEGRIKVGNLAETEIAAAQAETALRREALINARSALSTARLRLLRLIDPDALRGPGREVLLATDPAVPAVDLDAVEAHVAVALRMRPDMNQARMKLQSGDIELVRTRNGLLPKMDLFISLGDTGYAGAFGSAVGKIDGADMDVTAGLTLELPLGNRQARAAHQRALCSREQMAESLKNMEDLVRVDVESARIEVDRTREQLAATATTRRFQEEKLRAETAKFNVGRSAALLVAQAQRDLVSSQVAEVDAVVAHLKALVNLFRLDGSLLERRGLVAPGRQPAQA
jgi:outer membrane protein